MSVLSRLAGAQGRKDEEPNKELARDLVEKKDVGGIQEVVENLTNADRRVQTDCLSVLEQIGLLNPELIEGCVAGILALVFHKDNRIVWAAMIVLALVADRKPQEIFQRYEDLARVTEKGSVITKDNGIKTLARVAAAGGGYSSAIAPFLLEQLRTSRAKSVPQYAESIRVAVDADNQARYLAILNERFGELSAAQQRRVKKVLKTF